MTRFIGARRILFSGSRPKVYAGGAAGADYQLLTAATLANFSTNITHPAPGYAGRLDIFIIGTGMNAGYYYNASSDITYGAPGEGAYWQYQCLGDETGFTLQQINYAGYVSASDRRLTLSIVGGVRNGLSFVVGSGADNNTGYGNGGCQYNLSNSNTPAGATLIRSGCIRQDYIAYYDDATQYSPAAVASYGQASETYTFNTSPTSLTMYFASSLSGMLYNGINYGFGNFHSASYSGGRHPNSRGACLLVFKNNH
jgi:hypothetical protein